MKPLRRIRDGSLHLIPVGTSLPGGLTEKLWFLHLIASFLPQVLDSPWWSCCLSQPPPVPAAGAVPLQGDGAKSQSNGKQQAWGRRKSSSYSFELRANCPASGQWGDPAKELALPQLCERRWCWGQHSDQLCHPHLAKSWSRPEQLLSLLPDIPGDVSDSSCSTRLLPAAPAFPAPNQKACLKICPGPGVSPASREASSRCRPASQEEMKLSQDRVTSGLEQHIPALEQDIPSPGAGWLLHSSSALGSTVGLLPP